MPAHSTPPDASGPEGRSVFAGRFPDLPESEQRSARWREPDHRAAVAAAQVMSNDGAAADADLAPVAEQSAYGAQAYRKNAAPADLAPDPHPLPGGETLYLVRSAMVSTGQALDRGRVTLDEDGRRRQIARLREFRGDTRHAATAEVRRWVAEQLPTRPTACDSGAVSAGVVVPMTPEEARQMARDVPDLVLMRNRAMTLVPPVHASTAVTAFPPGAAWHLDAIGMSAARRDGKAYTGRGVTIAVLDTGIQRDHAELAGKVSAAWKIRANPRTSDYHALLPDLDHGDTDGHGTHVAGLICGVQAGVAPDAKLVSLLLMPYRLATTFDFIRCLDWVAEHPEINLVNCSAGVTPFSADMAPFVSDLINTGALLIAAVGNSGPNNTLSPGNYVDGMSVGAVDAPGTRVSSFSGSALQTWDQALYNVPDLVAPGADVWSSVPTGRFNAMSGTSMAAPIVTGVAACLIEQAKGLLSPLDLVDLLTRSCAKLAGEADLRQGAGLVQVPRRP